MKIKEGGAVSNLTRQQSPKKIEEIRAYNDTGRSVSLLINDDCLSYLTIEEALDLKNELTNALKNILENK